MRVMVRQIGALAALFLSASALAAPKAGSPSKATAPVSSVTALAGSSGSTALARDVKTLEDRVTATSRASGLLAAEVGPLVERRRKLLATIEELRPQSAEHLRQAREAESRYSRGLEAAQRGDQPEPSRDALAEAERAYRLAATSTQALSSALAELRSVNQTLDEKAVRAGQLMADGAFAKEEIRKVGTPLGQIAGKLSGSGRTATRDTEALLRKTGHDRSGTLAKKIKKGDERAAALQANSANAKARLASVEKSLEDASHAAK